MLKSTHGGPERRELNIGLMLEIRQQGPKKERPDRPPPNAALTNNPCPFRLGELGIISNGCSWETHLYFGDVFEVDRDGLKALVFVAHSKTVG
jgi:hypothetical protein